MSAFQQQFPGRELERFGTRSQQGGYPVEGDQYFEPRTEQLEKIGRGEQVYGREHLEKSGREQFIQGEQEYGREPLEKFGREQYTRGEHGYGRQFTRGEHGYGREEFTRGEQEYGREPLEKFGREQYTRGEHGYGREEFKKDDREHYSHDPREISLTKSGSFLPQTPGLQPGYISGRGIPYRGVDRSQGWWKPRAEIIETEDGLFRVEFELPGVPVDSLTLLIEADTLILDTVKPQSRKQDAAYKWLTERRFGNFYRKLQLPSNVDGARTSVALDHGVLKLLLPKTDTPSPRIVIRGNQIRSGPSF